MKKMTPAESARKAEKKKLAIWSAACAERVLAFFEEHPRPRTAETHRPQAETGSEMASPAAKLPPIFANLDGVVDAADFAIWSTNPGLETYSQS